MSSDPLRLPSGHSPAGREPEPELHDSVLLPRLAGLLVRFDHLLADEIRDHLEARAEELDGSAARIPSPRRAETATRYRSLAQLIESLAPQHACVRS